MNRKLFIPFFLIANILFTSCSESDGVEPMRWLIDNGRPDNITVDYTEGEVTAIDIAVGNDGGSVVLNCANYDGLKCDAADIADDYGWLKISMNGSEIALHFPNEYSCDGYDFKKQITVTPRSGGTAATVISISRTADDNILPSRYKFKLAQNGFTPYTDCDFTQPAPFEYIKFKVTDTDGNFSPLGFPEYALYYDSIVWSAEGCPNSFAVYKKYKNSSGDGESFTAQWGSCFFTDGCVKSYLKGYRDGEIVHCDSLEVNVTERDFLCFDWVNGSASHGSTSSQTAYCLLDTRYEYIFDSTREVNGAKCSRIYSAYRNELPEEENIAIAQASLQSLMEKNIGTGELPDAKVEQFKGLPDDAKAEWFWENGTTRILLLHRQPSDVVEERYFLHIESK